MSSMEMGLRTLNNTFFVCEAIWTTKKIQDQDAKISWLATTFKDIASIQYMKFQSTVPAR